MRCKYFRAQAPLIAAPLPRYSLAQWKQLHKLITVFSTASRWVVGEGKLSFWFHNWSGRGALFNLLTEGDQTDQVCMDLSLKETLLPNGD